MLVHMEKKFFSRIQGLSDFGWKIGVLLATSLLYWFVLRPAQPGHSIDYVFLCFWESSWLVTSHFFSALLSFLILGRLLARLPSDQNNHTRWVRYLSLAGLCVFLIGIGLFVLGMILYKYWGFDKLIFPSRIYYAATIIIILYYFLLDWCVYYAHKKSGSSIFPNVSGVKWGQILKYNTAILVASFLIIFIGDYTADAYNEFLGKGFSGGATAFQLIVAHWFFELKNYNIV